MTSKLFGAARSLCYAGVATAAVLGAAQSALFAARTSGLPGPSHWLTALLPAGMANSCSAGVYRGPTQPLTLAGGCQKVLDASAIRALAGAPSDAHEQGSEAIYHLAERVSRRDFETQVHLLNLAAQNGNLGEVLRHYDRLLSVSPSSASQLFPSVSGALANPGFRHELAAYAQRPWFPDLLLHAAQTRADPDAVVELAAALRGSGPLRQETTGTLSAVATALGERGALAASAKVIDTIPGINPRLLSAFGFNPATLDSRFAALGWTIRQDELIWSDASRTGRVDFEIAPLARGVIASRTIRLRPGPYRLAIVATNPSASDPVVTLDWTLACPASAPVSIGQIRSQKDDTPQFLALTIPPGCDSQRWTVSIDMVDTQYTTHLRLGPLELASN